MLEAVTVGVLAIQGAFVEHITLLDRAALSVPLPPRAEWRFIEVRTAKELTQCDALIIPGGESTTVSLVAAQSGLLEPLRRFVKEQRKPTWGTCAGLILLANEANRTKRGGQELIGGLDVRVNRNHFGRQTESFEARLELPFLQLLGDNAGGHVCDAEAPFHGIFIRAPIVEAVLSDKVLPGDETICAPETQEAESVARPLVKIMASLPGKGSWTRTGAEMSTREDDAGSIVAVSQGNIFGTSFHPELTDDPRIHVWWLRTIIENSDLVRTD